LTVSAFLLVPKGYVELAAFSLAAVAATVFIQPQSEWKDERRKTGLDRGLNTELPNSFTLAKTLPRPA